MAELAVILVHSTSHAIAAERVLKRAGLEVKLVPTPRHLSSNCGSAVRIPARDGAVCEQLLQAAGVPVDRIELLSERKRGQEPFSEKGS
ncbi:MAG TPA: DUF3343 domain-containing protein [Phycisphaerae bacterium]|nr:DUF3343 domain-containing protein [Phycisphaerae bacterium]HNU46550.1 DUF3343 domain-containing protein [Phycisphaerae bacterium]